MERFNSVPAVLIITIGSIALANVFLTWPAWAVLAAAVAIALGAMWAGVRFAR